MPKSSVHSSGLNGQETLSSDFDSDSWLENTNYIGRFNHWLESLPQEHCDVLQHRFGLNGYELSTLDQTGAAVGITRERTRQVQKEALGMIRDKVASNGFDRG